MNSKILLTGATGFIGRHLLSNKNIVRCVVRGREIVPDVDNYTISDLSSKTNWSGAFNGVDTVIHLAGLAHTSNYNEDELNEVNCRSVVHLANSAYNSGVRRFVFVSSIGVNGNSTTSKKYSPDDICSPHNSYALSKYEAENKLKEISSKTGLELVIVRPTLVYGQSAPGKFGLLNNLVCKVPILPFACVDNKRHFISVLNLADLLIKCASHPNAPGNTFLAAEGSPISIKELTNTIAKCNNRKLIQVPIPPSLMKFAGSILGKKALVEQLIGDLEVDNSNLLSVLDWVPPFSMDYTLTQNK